MIILVQRMWEAMAEADERKIPLKRINSKQEYEHHKMNNEYCLGERFWLMTTKDPLLEVSKKIKEEMKKLDDVERGSSEENAILKDIHVLQVKFDMLRDGCYESVLIDNINAETLLLDEYELSDELPFKKYILRSYFWRRKGKKIKRI